MAASIPPTGQSPGSGGDEMVFMDEAPAHGAAMPTSAWRVMVVDDDEDVHSTTTFALGGVEIQERRLEFLHAYSAEQARELLAREDGIAVVLLDVVMEQDDAGLHLVRHIRDTLKLADVRIILRTGQPGYAPEIDAIRAYDINDYRTKSELTRIKLYTAVTSAIRSYQQITAISSSQRGLDRIVRASTELMALHGAQEFCTGVLAQLASLLRVDPHGVACARHELDVHGGHELHVVAGIGRLHAASPGLLAAEREPRLADAMERALADRANIIEPGCVALFLGSRTNREVVACLELDPGRPLPDIDPRLLDIFATNVAVGLDNVSLVSHLHEAAFYDQLTKLPNRTRLVEMLEAALAGPQRDAALALVDIDHFAETNDALGHQFGDMLLVAVAERLRARLPRSLAIARISGDIFAVLGDASVLDAQHILGLFAAPFSIDGQDAPVSATLGLVRLLEHEGSGTDVLKDADIALKRAKTQQRGGHFYYSNGMGVEIRERVRMMHALRNGFARNELSIVYQPQVDLETRRTVGAEALLRWQAPDGQYVSPDSFIPIAEYSGLIIEIGQWVLRNACKELVRLRALGHLDFTMSVNVSQVQFRHPGFLGMLKDALAESKAPPEFLELEITESVAMEEPDLLIRMLAQVKQAGVSIAIDDFGTGFSSLSYLQRLQVDRLKIDRAFVTEITGSSRGSSIAEMVIQLGRNLGLSIVAEGVEDERQAQVLGALGCSLAQGFLFSRPLAAPALTHWLENSPALNAA